MQIKSLLIKAAVRCKDGTGQGYGGEQAGLLIGAVQGGTHNSPPVAAILYSAIAGIVIKPGHNDLIKKNTFFGIRQKKSVPVSGDAQRRILVQPDQRMPAGRHHKSFQRVFLRFLLIVCEETAVQRKIGFPRIVQFNTVGISTICISSGREITAADFVDDDLGLLPTVAAAGGGQRQRCKKQDYFL